MKRFKFLTVAGILVLACGAALADPVRVYFNPADSYQGVGSSFDISILADIPQDPGLVDFGFNLGWDQSMMQLNNVTGTGSPWDILWDPGTPASITGLLFPTPTSPASESGSGVLLANLEFTCLREGSSTLDIALDSGLVAQGLQGFYDPTGSPLAFTVTAGSVDQGTAALPEPNSILLLSTGVIGLAFWRKPK